MQDVAKAIGQNLMVGAFSNMTQLHTAEQHNELVLSRALCEASNGAPYERIAGVCSVVRTPEVVKASDADKFQLLINTRLAEREAVKACMSGSAASALRQEQIADKHWHRLFVSIFDRNPTDAEYKMLAR